MKLITCASYYGTGSSAVTDFVSEFDDVHSFTDEEFRFVQDPEGISDLEYNLVENYNRHNSGHALKRYKRLVDFYSGNRIFKRYEGFFHGNWKKYSYEYIDKLTSFSYRGWWQYDLMDRGKFFYFRKRILNKLLHLTIWRNKPDRQLNTMKKEVTLGTHPTENYFIESTKEYIENLFSSVSEGLPMVMVDQIVPPTNLKRYLRYFKDIKVVVVDRDPRDIFVLDKYVWKDGAIPNDVDVFCKWFKMTREHRKTDVLETENTTFLKFEDMIFNYEETSRRLVSFLGLDESRHSKKKIIFNPDVSIKNTRTWERVECDPEEIKVIEKQLADYLYFPVSGDK